MTKNNSIPSANTRIDALRGHLQTSFINALKDQIPEAKLEFYENEEPPQGWFNKLRFGNRAQLSAVINTPSMILHFTFSAFDKYREIEIETHSGKLLGFDLGDKIECPHSVTAALLAIDNLKDRIIVANGIRPDHM